MTRGVQGIRRSVLRLFERDDDAWVECHRSQVRRQRNDVTSLRHDVKQPPSSAKVLAIWIGFSNQDHIFRGVCKLSPTRLKPGAVFNLYSLTDARPIGVKLEVTTSRRHVIEDDADVWTPSFSASKQSLLELLTDDDIAEEDKTS